jgi:hypothetical protein
MSINEIIASIKAGPNDITLYPGAPRELIEEFQAKTGIKLPSELTMFYQECNGFESAEDLFRIVPLDEILERIDYDRNHYHLKPNQFYLAEYLIYCDSWKIEVDLHHPDQYKIYEGPSITGDSGIVLTSSFVEFVSRFLTGGVFEDNGLYKWGELIRTGI